MNIIHNILIVGYGFVGQAVHHSLIASAASAKHFNISILDPAKGHELGTVDPSSTIFICVPSPQSETGECDDSIVISTVEKFVGMGTLVVRSTVPPSTIDKLLEIDPALVYMPEFLREKSWKEDSINPPMIIIGSVSTISIDKVVSILDHSSIMPAVLLEHCWVCHPKEASLYKYVANTFLAMKVVYMHEMFNWLNKSGMSQHWESLIHMLSADKRIGSTHLKAPGDHGLGYSGTCFPKDTKALIAEGGGHLSLLEAVDRSNTALRQMMVE